MTGALLLAAAAAAAPAGPRLTGIAARDCAGRPCVVLTLTASAEMGVGREGSQLVVTLGADAAPDLAPPAAAPPLESARLERSAGHSTLRLGLSAAVPYELQRDATELRVVLGESPGSEETPPDAGELYRSILPAGAEEAGAPTPVSPPAEPGPGKPAAEGYHLGPVALRPSLQGGYVSAQNTPLGTPQTVDDQYYAVEPRLELEAPVSDGRLTASYDARLRFGSSYSALNSTSNFLDAGLELPIGSSLALQVSEHYASGVLESYEVDPGYEYFFDFGHFQRNLITAGLRLNSGGRLDLDVHGSYNDVDVSQDSGFYPYQERSAGASLGYELAPRLRLALNYDHLQIPTPAEHPEAGGNSDSIGASLTGDIAPRLKGEAGFGYERRDTPDAGPGGQSYRSWIATLSLLRDITRNSSLRLGAGRGPELSSFEDNGFYVSNFVDATLVFQLPLQLAAQAGVGYRVNDYQVVASGLQEPRQDTILGWSGGLGRPLTNWAYVRVDYRADRRDSNVKEFDGLKTYTFLAQIGIGIFKGRQP